MWSINNTKFCKFTESLSFADDVEDCGNASIMSGSVGNVIGCSSSPMMLYLEDEVILFVVMDVALQMVMNLDQIFF